VTIRGAFYRQGPFLGSGGLYSPGPATASLPFGWWDDRWTTLSRHPGSWPVLRPSLGSVRLTARSFARRDHRNFRPDGRASLGPRSLVPPLFLERCVRAYSRPIAACRLLQLLLRRTSNPTRTLVFSTVTKASTFFLFYASRRTSLLAKTMTVTRGGPRSARKAQPRCRFLLLAQVCPTAIPNRPRHLCLLRG
jgi:hypothetical protein